MKRFYKILIWTFGILLLVLSFSIIISPFGKKEGFDYKLLKYSVNIDATADSVFRFLGNSGNAQKWSVFVDHISPLNSDTIPDGMSGSKRRCFCNKDKTGMIWDETLLEVIPQQKRQISCYAFKNFPMIVEGITTEQLYESLNDGKCKLTFTFFIRNSELTYSESLKLYFGSYKVYNIFKRNLENVKAICEGKPATHPRK